MAAAATDSGGEAIIICIDNTVLKPDYYEAQLEAVRSYATYKIQSHPRTVVGISTMSRLPIHNPSINIVLDPTRDLNEIFHSFQRIVRSSELDITETIFNCLFMLSSGLPKRVQKRIVMLAGGIINMGVEVAIEFGKGLKNKGIAVDVVNFTLGDELDFRKKKLEAFVVAVNNNDNSHIIHVDDGSSLSNLLSSFMAGDEHVDAKGMKHNTIIIGDPDSDSGGEAIIICIDSTILKPEYYEAQLEAVRSYATYKIQSHPRTVVGLSTMSRTPYNHPNIKLVLDPTRDLKKIFDSFQHIVCGGELDIIEAIFNCLLMFSSGLPERVEKRIVMFAGGIINMAVEVAHEYGNPLRKQGIAVDVVNFTLGDEADFRKKKLEAFVAAVNNNDNSHIIHVDEGSSLSKLLSSFMVKTKVLIPSKTQRLSKPLSMDVRPKFKVKLTDLEAMETTDRVGFKETAPLLGICKSTVVNETREYVKSEESKVEKLKEQPFFVEEEEDNDDKLIMKRKNKKMMKTTTKKKNRDCHL